MRTAILAIACCTMIALTWSIDAATDTQRYWPQWRGPLASGEAPGSEPPTEWNESQNIRWKVEIPGKGHGSAIVWEDKVFVVSAVPGEQQTDLAPSPPAEPEPGRRRGQGGNQPQTVYRFTLFAINRQDGSILWERAAREGLPHAGTHNDGSWASSSPVTDGEHVYAYFGSAGLYCFDMQGELKWEKDFGDMTTRNSFGEGSSPALHGDVVVINWDHEGPSFITALDKRTGDELWRNERDEPTSWSTPVVVIHDGIAQVITSATNRTRAYNLANGDLLWECGGMTANVIPSPVSAEGVVYLISGFRGNALQAVRLADAKGDITGTDALVWELDRDTPYVPSPLLYEDTLYFLKQNKGILSSFKASTGELHYGPERLDGISGVYASPVGANGHVYIAGRKGTTLVVKHGPKFEVVAQNILDDSFDASPAIVDDELYLRGHQYLYCVASD